MLNLKQITTYIPLLKFISQISSFLTIFFAHREREVRRSFLTGHLYIYKLASTHPCKEILHPQREREINSTKMIQSLLVFVLSLHIVTALIYGSDAPERKVRTYVHGTCIFSV